MGRHAARWTTAGVCVLAVWIAGGIPWKTQAQTVAQDAPAKAVAEARGVAKELTAELRRLLSEELAKGGFAGAVRVCAEQAQTATGAFNNATGASARRVSLRYRNGLNQPDPFEERLLREWQGLPPSKELPAESSTVQTDSQGKRHLRYWQPIRVQAMCLTCHGDPAGIPAEVKQILASRYPKDLATGYKAGDLRGAVSVRIPLD
jgi:hypothetical protein